jgi:hypothetical protein
MNCECNSLASLPPGERGPKYTFYRLLVVTQICSGHGDDSISVFQSGIKYQLPVL